MAGYTALGYSDENVALNKPASQVSTYSSCVANLAVDGLQDTESCTLSFVHPWLSVDLQTTYRVDRVTVMSGFGAGNYGRTCSDYHHHHHLFCSVAVEQ